MNVPAKSQSVQGYVCRFIRTRKKNTWKSYLKRNNMLKFLNQYLTYCLPDGFLFNFFEMI